MKLLRAPSLTNICEQLLLIFKYSGVQPVIFQSRGGFVKLGHFDKLFFKNTREKLLQGNILELFFLDTHNTRFWVKIQPKDGSNLVRFSKIRALFPIFKKQKEGGKGLLLTPLPSLLFVARLNLKIIHKVF